MQQMDERKSLSPRYVLCGEVSTGGERRNGNKRAGDENGTYDSEAANMHSSVSSKRAIGRTGFLVKGLPLDVQTKENPRDHALVSTNATSAWKISRN
jgi:hypothetical protein